ncbi:GNAT family N-acetyltransferase [Planococcus lenghuensis]|uniref:GNAT family N-acetyltransferase n=1 Tax=Planococcus lenghuensis TaxID=2213202 RepID=A0A1Q2KVG6_9BACL|nr:GNAT family N-acetyltransferase [Planococcus lenghuensis]AQQ52106.1 GNAT family N-acetyltransferase [Planococcus lenghuensis]
MIRPGTEQDIGAVQEIARQSWRSTYADILPVQVQQIALDKSYSSVMMQKRIERTILLIAEHEGSPIGFANFTKVDEDGDAELIAMHIKTEFQRNGYGTQLMSYGIEQLAGGRQLSAFVEADNEIARCFYEANGFVFIQEFEELLEGYPVYTAEYILSLQHEKTPAL